MKNSELFDRFEALTFDDILIVPGYTEVLPNQTDIGVQLTPEIKLNIPILSAAMDTVTKVCFTVLKSVASTDLRIISYIIGLVLR